MSWDDLIRESKVKDLQPRDLCHLSAFMAIEDNTSLIVGNDIGIKGTQSAMLNARKIAFDIGEILMLAGSTPHAGDVYPESASSSSTNGCHMRIFIQVSPAFNRESNIKGFVPDPHKPQWKLTEDVCLNV